MSSVIKVAHLARVEGHGGITVEIDGGAVAEVRFDIFEGARLIEGLLRGRGYDEVAPVVSRICAICSVAHTLTSLKATENAFGIEISSQTQLLRDLLFLGESIESHALHLFLLALPDYLGYPSALAMAADHADAVRLGLRLKQLGNAIQETIGGRAVHPVNTVLGGFGCLPSTDALIDLRQRVLAALDDCDAVLELVAGLPPADFCQSPTAYAALRVPHDYGYYSGEEISALWDGSRRIVPAAAYRSIISEKAVPHSHAKHSLFEGRPLMVGALARLAVNGGKLGGRAAGALRRFGLSLPSANPMDNNLAQAVELFSDLEHSASVLDHLLRTDLRPEAAAAVRPRAGTGTAVTEAPRGLLIHSYTYGEDGKIIAADIVTPTAINAASIEDRFRHLVEQSPDTESPALTRSLEMVARAYDPCLSCSVHLVRRARAR